MSGQASVEDGDEIRHGRGFLELQSVDAWVIARQP
jgi:hypothetical protein